MYNKTDSDSVLLKKYIRGNEFALELLIKRHQKRIYSFIYSKIKDRSIADDIFQDTFIKVIKTVKSGRYNEEGKFLPWVMRISYNLVIDHFRYINRMPKFNNTDDFDIFSVLSDGDLNIENRIVQEQITSSVKDILEELPNDQKEVLKMRIYAGMSFSEISEATGVSINTALGRMRYAIINIRKIIEKNNIVLTEQ